MRLLRAESPGYVCFIEVEQSHDVEKQQFRLHSYKV
jgi:hypothetical protein